ncbi:hypothetical protein evm_010561 [Chilo suppressalis]|nr:hypothetical protein evm_010561 [Chilo suppressalis]
MLVIELFFYSVLLVIDYQNVFGEEEEEELKRFIIEEDYKPPIFGSYRFDPICGTFDIKVHHNDSEQIVNSSYVLSTAVGVPETTTARLIRSNNNIIDPAKPITAWWARKKTVTKST